MRDDASLCWCRILLDGHRLLWSMRDARQQPGERCWYSFSEESQSMLKRSCFPNQFCDGSSSPGKVCTMQVKHVLTSLMLLYFHCGGTCKRLCCGRWRGLNALLSFCFGLWRIVSSYGWALPVCGAEWECAYLLEKRSQSRPSSEHGAGMWFEDWLTV